MASVTPTAVTEQPKLENEEELWGYGRPFEAMRVDNLEVGKDKKKGTSAIKILAVGATAVVTGILLFL